MKNMKKLFFHEKSMFSWPLPMQFSVFVKNKKLGLRVTERQKAHKYLIFHVFHSIYQSVFHKMKKVNFYQIHLIPFENSPMN